MIHALENLRINIEFHKGNLFHFAVLTFKGTRNWLNKGFEFITLIFKK